MKINTDPSTKKHLRIYAGIGMLLIFWMLYANSVGDRIFASSGGPQQWSRSGPGYHK